METFDVNELYSIKGKSGLWKLRAVVARAGMANFENLTTKDTTTVKLDRCLRLKDVIVHTGNKQNFTLEQIFDNMIELSDNKEFPDVDKFDSLSAEEQHKWMEKFAPDHDPDLFRSYHMRKIWKWFKEIYTALEMLNEDKSEKDKDADTPAE